MTDETRGKGMAGLLGEAAREEPPPIQTTHHTDDDANVPVVTTAVDYPTVYADGVWFAANMLGNVRITFLENLIEPRNSPQPGIKSRHVGTLVMPRAGFDSMVAYLNSMKATFDALDIVDGDT